MGSNDQRLHAVRELLDKYDIDDSDAMVEAAEVYEDLLALAQQPPAVPDAVWELVQQLRDDAANRCGCYDSDNPMPGCDCYNAGDTFSEGVNQARLEIAGRLEHALAQQAEREHYPFITPDMERAGAAVLDETDHGLTSRTVARKVYMAMHDAAHPDGPDSGEGDVHD